MVTAVLLLLLPAVFSLSVFRLYQLPRDLRARAVRVNSHHKLLFALVLGIIYAVLAAYTIFVLFTAARAIWTPPKTIQEFFSIAYVGAAYPLICLVFEWILYYAVTPKANPQSEKLNYCNPSWLHRKNGPQSH